MNYYGLFGKLTAVTGKREELLHILLEAAQSMQHVSGCLVYAVHTADEYPNDVIVYEVWQDEAAHQESLSLDVTQTLIRKAKPIIAGMERMHTLHVHGISH